MAYPTGNTFRNHLQFINTKNTVLMDAEYRERNFVYSPLFISACSYKSNKPCHITVDSKLRITSHYDTVYNTYRLLCYKKYKRVNKTIMR